MVGRDHARVGSYYGKYEAYELSGQFDGELGIQIMRLHGPYHCQICEGIITEWTCPHLETDCRFTRQINGTDIRKMLLHLEEPDRELIRKDVTDVLEGMKIFIDG